MGCIRPSAKRLMRDKGWASNSAITARCIALQLQFAPEIIKIQPNNNTSSRESGVTQVCLCSVGRQTDRHRFVAVSFKTTQAGGKGRGLGQVSWHPSTTPPNAAQNGKETMLP